LDGIQPQPIAMTIRDAVKVSGLSRSKIYAELKDGRLRALKAGGRTLILRAELERYFERLSNQSPQQAAAPAVTRR
jgi:excisionase family DNA binding protein